MSRGKEKKKVTETIYRQCVHLLKTTSMTQFDVADELEVNRRTLRDWFANNGTSVVKIKQEALNREVWGLMQSGANRNDIKSYYGVGNSSATKRMRNAREFMSELSLDDQSDLGSRPEKIEVKVGSVVMLVSFDRAQGGYPLPYNRLAQCPQTAETVWKRTIIDRRLSGNG